MTKTVALSEVAVINPRVPKDLSEQMEVSFLPMAAVSEDGLVVKEETRIAGEVKKGYTYFERNDLLIAKITPCFENGKAALLSHLKHDVGFGSTEFHVIRPDPYALDAKYAFYLFWNPAFRRVGEQNMTGSAGQKRVPADFLARTKIPLPPLREQKRIAAILDKADSLRRKRQHAIQLADQFLRAVFLDMFGEQKRAWKVVSVEQLAAQEKGSIRTGPFGSQLLHSEFTDEGIAVLGIDNVVENEFRWAKARFVSKEKYEELRRYTVKPGDLLITIMGTCGRSAIVPVDCPTAINTKHLCCITLNSKVCTPEFLHSYFLMHPRAAEYLAKTAKGAVMDGLNMGIIKELPVYLPPVTLQKEYSCIYQAQKRQRSRLVNIAGETEKAFSSLSKSLFAVGEPKSTRGAKRLMASGASA